jgi:hypothetical protein
VLDLLFFEIDILCPSKIIKNIKWDNRKPFLRPFSSLKNSNAEPLIIIMNEVEYRNAIIQLAI